MRLQKKARKGAKMNELHKALQDVSDRKAVLEETEKRAVREALIEERSRYCIFVTFLKPVLVSLMFYFLLNFGEIFEDLNYFIYSIPLNIIFVRKKKLPCLWNYPIYKKLWIN